MIKTNNGLACVIIVKKLDMPQWPFLPIRITNSVVISTRRDER
jgi:hypothetical protein